MFLVLGCFFPSYYLHVVLTLRGQRTMSRNQFSFHQVGSGEETEVHSLVRRHLQPEPSNPAQIRMILVVVTATIMVAVVMCVDRRSSAAAVSFRNSPT